MDLSDVPAFVTHDQTGYLLAPLQLRLFELTACHGSAAYPVLGSLYIGWILCRAAGFHGDSEASTWRPKSESKLKASPAFLALSSFYSVFRMYKLLIILGSQRFNPVSGHHLGIHHLAAPCKNLQAPCKLQIPVFLVSTIHVYSSSRDGRFKVRLAHQQETS